MSTILTSIILGALAGALYGVAYIWHHKRLFLAADTNSFQVLLYPLMVGARVGALGVVAYFLLLSGIIHLIIFVGAFFTTFWLLIFKQKV
jgi:hypothetical protein